MGGKQPNPWRLYGMLGDTWDWCRDVYDAEVYGTSTDSRESSNSAR